jgi:hypothetical protein
VVVVVCGFVCLCVGLRAWVCCVHTHAQMGHHNLRESCKFSRGNLMKKTTEYGEQNRKPS